MQKILIAILPVFLAVALIAPPSFGPFLDHHFAERQPYHAHLGAGGGHEHDYRREHSHARADSPDSRTADGDEAMPNPEIASSAMAAVRSEQVTMTPTAAADSALAAARGGDSIPKSVHPAPPLRPPRADAAAFVFPL